MHNLNGGRLAPNVISITAREWQSWQ